MENPSPGSSIFDSGAYQPLPMRDRVIVLSGIAMVALVGWVYMIYMAWAMNHMDVVDMWMPPQGDARPWSFHDFWMLFLMWSVMMAAMMAPVVSPFVIMYETVRKNKKQSGVAYTPTFVFLSGYLIAWSIYSAAATVVQWPLHQSELLSPMMNSRSYLFSGLILVSAGIYQWTPLKDACLNQCRTPLNFVMTHWREGNGGAVKMGMHHGLYCIGCCWALMMVLFAVGVMNILWMAVITLLILLEKFLPGRSRIFRTTSGLVFVTWGSYWISLYPF